jgi:hypothetical protein
VKVSEAESFTRESRKDAGIQRVEHNRKWRRDAEKLARDFVAWDGEGYNADDRHYYSLFGNSLGGRVQKPSLSWRDCINLLLAAPKDCIHVIYAGTYDVVMMFRDEPIITRLLKGQPVKYEGYRLLYRKGEVSTSY